MMSYICVVLANILVFQSLLSNRCLGQNFTDSSYVSSVETTPQTFNITEVTNYENVTVKQVTTHDGMTSQPQDGMTSQPQDGMTSQPQDGMTTQPQDGLPSQDETTDWLLEPSPTMDYVVNTTDFEIITEVFYISSITPDLVPSQLTDTTDFITQQFESMITTNHVKSTADLSSFIPDIQTSSSLVPDTTFDIPASSVIVPSSSIVTVSPTLITTSPKQTDRPEGPTQAVKDYKFTMKMAGNCDNVKRDEYTFKQACIDAITERTGVDKEQIMIDKVLCGSIILEFTFYDRTSDDKGSEMLEMASDEEPLVIRFDNKDYYVVEVEQVIPTTVSSDDGGLSIEDQRLLIYIIAGGLCGFVIILTIGVCLGQNCRNRSKKRDKDISFQTEHLTKLSDINLTNTIIPRPKSIYANMGDYETRCSLFAITNNYYYYNNGAFMYDEETQPNGDITSNDGEGGVMFAVEVNEPTTPGAKASEQFGMSGIPEWKLPQLEGVVRAGSEVEAGSDTASVHEFSRPSSRTFSVPFPPPPPPLPPNQDATVTDIILPVPQLNRQSDAFSEITDSSGDTNMLLRGGSKRKEEKKGLDNAGLQIDENTSRESTLTRNRPGSQLASYEALSRL